MSAHETTLALHEVRRSSDRSFGLVFAGVFLVVAAWPLVFGDGSLRLWAAAIAAAFAAAALFHARALAPLNRLWFRLGLLLHKVVSPLVLGLMFFAVVLPVGVVARLFGKDFLSLRIERAAPTYWERRERRIEPDSFRDLF